MRARLLRDRGDVSSKSGVRRNFGGVGGDTGVSSRDRWQAGKTC